MCIASWISLGYDVVLYTFDTSLKVPEGVDRRPASQILDSSEFTLLASGAINMAEVSDVFRYRLLASEDTIWLDLDYLLLRPLPATPYIFGWEARRVINGAVLSAPQQSALVRNLNLATTSYDMADQTWGKIGPALLTDQICLLGLRKLAYPGHFLYPLSPLEVWRLFDPKSQSWVNRRCKDAHGVHLWNAMLGGNRVKDRLPPSNSFIDNQLRKLGLEPNVRLRLDPDWVNGEWRQFFKASGSRRQQLEHAFWRLGQKAGGFLD
jgi:hypothetical protein